MNPETINVGDKLNMTDLRVAETYPVTVVGRSTDRKFIVQRDDNGAKYNVDRGFLTVRR